MKKWILKLDRKRYGFDEKYPHELIIPTRGQVENLVFGALDFIEAGCTGLYTIEGDD